MILSGRELHPNGQTACDVCIIGAGAAGIVLACELENSGLDIVVLEAGGLSFVANAQEGLIGKVVPDSLHPPPQMYRRHALGGATTIWGGRCVPLDPIDLSPRPYVPNSGWPITWEELEDFYPRAMAYCQAGDYKFDVEEALGTEATATIEGFSDQHLLMSRLERFSPPTNFGKTYLERLKRSQNVRVILQAKATYLYEKDSAIVGVDIQVGPERRHNFTATQVVLAMGGLETTRLLMISDTTSRGGMGNMGGALGRFYMCHVENTLGRLKLTPTNRPITTNFERTSEGVYVRRKITLSAEAQQEQKLLNTTARFHYPLIADPSHNDGVLSMIYLLKETVIPEYRRKLATIELINSDRLVRDKRFWMSHVSNVGLDVVKVAGFSIDWLRRRTLAKRKLPFIVVSREDGSYPLDINAEQIPDRENRVTLSSERDAMGLRRLSVNWRLTEQDIDSVVRCMHLMRGIFARSKCATLEFDDHTLLSQVAASTPIGGHHLGTARMSDSPVEGVVDKNCKVHGISNLYVASGAVFPTCGHANPTLTIVALAIRLAERILALEKATASKGSLAHTRPMS